MMTAVRSLAETYPDQKRVLVLGSMLELGSESEKYHFHVGVELAHFALEQVFGGTRNESRLGRRHFRRCVEKIILFLFLDRRIGGRAQKICANGNGHLI
jgi:UDP-N-acetylmuramyl pentapeptide synthase